MVEQSDPELSQKKDSEALDAQGNVKAVITYRNTPTSQPLPVLKLSITRHEFEQIRVHLPKTCEKLGPGRSLEERLMNTALPIFSKWRATLRAIMASAGTDHLDDKIVQCFVLSQPDIEPTSLIPDLRVSPSVPANARSTVNRTEFPKDVGEILSDVQKEYSGKGRSLIVGGHQR
jgi:hypothetical protein